MGRTKLAIAVLLCAVTLAAHAPLREAGFVRYDDNIYTYDNPHLRAGLSGKGIAWAFAGTYGYDANWIPLTWLSLLADYELWGLDPRGYHATNLALHVLASLALFLALARMTGAPWKSGFATAVFAVHPLHVESVAWVAERKDVLSGLFWMLTLYAYASQAQRPSRVRYALVLLALGLGLMAKPMLVTLPFALLLLDFWPLDRLREPGSSRLFEESRVRRALLEKLPMLALVAGASVAALLAQRAGGALMSTDRLPLDARFLNALHAYVAYLGKAFWPSDLAVFYPHPGKVMPLGRAALEGLLLLALSAGSLGLVRRAPYLAVGWLFYLGTLVPVIGVVQVGSAAMADRYTYVPLVGIAIAAAWGAPALFARLRRPAGARAALAMLGAAAVVAMAVSTSRQATVWRNTETLFAQALRATGENHVAHVNLGVELLREGRIDEAEPHFEAVLAIRPRNANARVGLGSIAMQREDVDAALRHYTEAVRLNPDLWEGHAGLGAVFAERGDYGMSVAHYFDAVRLAPERAEVHANLGRVLASSGRAEDALRHYETALRLDPDLALAHAYRGRTLEEQGRRQAAIASYERALRLDPQLTELHVRLALALLQQDRIDAALAHFERAVRQYPELPELHRAMADALRARGRHLEAAARYREALRRSPDSPQALNNLAWLLATTPDGSLRAAGEAIELAERAVALTERRDAALLDTLATAQAADGRFAEAERTAREALAAAADPGLSGQIRAKLEAYRARRRGAQVTPAP